MKTYVNVGSSRNFQLSRALLVYGESSYNGFPYRHPFVTLHEVIHDQGEARLGAAQLVTPGLLASLVADLGQSVPVEILPDCVLARTANMVVWWSPAKTRAMFFSDRGGDTTLHGFSGKQYPHPPLLFKASGRSLWIRALAQNTRPVADTKLCMAPYWNCYDNAVVCTGSMKTPQQKSIAAIREWEESFFQSAFSHAAGVQKHTCYPGGVLALWRSLQGKKVFPTKYLFPLKQTVEEFVTCNDTSYATQARNHL
jgi:PRTRC genetic system protein B